MADNYLENRMEEYRAGKLAPKTRRVVHVQSEGDMVLNFPELNALIIGGNHALISETVKHFRAVGARVALCHSDKKSYNTLAQNYGCRYYPFDENNEGCRMKVLDDLDERWGGLDTIIDLREGIDMEITPEMADDMATLMVIHSHPRFAFAGLIEWQR